MRDIATLLKECEPLLLGFTDNRLFAHLSGAAVGDQLAAINPDRGDVAGVGGKDQIPQQIAACCIDLGRRQVGLRQVEQQQVGLFAHFQ